MPEPSESTLFDPLRKKRVARTPEESVRQAIIAHFLDVCGIPGGLMAVEKGIDVQGAVLRPDLIVFGKNGKPWMVVECKAPRVALNQATVNQAANYNRRLKARYLLVTNGHEHRCVRMTETGVQYLDSLPPWPPSEDV